MTPEQFTVICQDFRAQLCEDPGMARYLDGRRESARRLLGLPPRKEKES